MQKAEREKGLLERVVTIKRVTKVVKGGKNFKLSATVVVGDGSGMVGIGHGKAQEVALAINKASERAKKNMAKVTVKRGTIPHSIVGRYGASRIVMKPASAGTGIVAPPQVKAVIEVCGITDILTKSLRSNNAYNMAMATISGLRNLRSLEEIAHMRNKPFSHFVRKRAGEREPQPEETVESNERIEVEIGKEENKETEGNAV